MVLPMMVKVTDPTFIVSFKDFGGAARDFPPAARVTLMPFCLARAGALIKLIFGSLNRPDKYPLTTAGGRKLVSDRSEPIAQQIFF